MIEPLHLQPLCGLVVLPLLAWLSGWRRGHGQHSRRTFPVRLVLSGLVLQFALAVLLLKLPLFKDGVLLLNQLLLAIQRATEAGTALVFGYLGGGPAPFDVVTAEHSYVLGFRALPLVITFSALSALLWHWRVVPLLIRGIARLLAHVLPVGGAVGLSSAASVFMSMVEAPLLIRPQLARLSDSELFVLMTCGMATVAGTVLGLYAAILGPVIPEALSQLVVASVISVPAAIVMALLMRPPESAGDVAPPPGMDPDYASSIEALLQGTEQGLKLFLNIVATLIVFVALVSLGNQLLAVIPTAGEPLSLQGMLGLLLQPLMWTLGIPWAETAVAGELMATKVILNELVSYLQLAALPEGELRERSRLILSYALCGFANFGSLGIMLGGLSALCPQRRGDFLRLAPLSLWSGTLATCMTGAVVALLIR